jgi:DNA primase
MSDTVQQIKERLSVVDVISGYVKLERAGSVLRARCPFHGERTPSFHVSLDRGTYHCFGCGVGGDMFSFIEAIEGVDFKGALKMLAEKAGVELVYSHGEKKDEKGRLFELMDIATQYYAARMSPEARTYLADRGLTDATIAAFRLGWADHAWSALCDHLRGKGFSSQEIIASGMGRQGDRGMLDKFRNRIMFPITDSVGRIIGFSGRIFGPHASPEAPKYLNSPETPLFHKSHVLYGFDRAKTAMRTMNCAILVEGQMDLVTSHQAGYHNTVAVSGTALTHDQALMIKRMTDNIVIALDADMAGIKAAGKGARASLAAGLNVKVASMPEGLDPADLILKHGNDAWKEVIKNSRDIITFLLDTLEQHIPQKNRFYTAVSASVLPFVREIHSPTARHRYIVEVARKIGASEQAVEEELAKLPAQEQESPEVSMRPVAKSVFGFEKGSDGFMQRAKRVYAFILWQQSAAQSVFDTTDFLARLHTIVGSDYSEKLRSILPEEQETLRFAAERDAPKDKLDRELSHMLDRLEREKLSLDHSLVTSALKVAESNGNEAEAERLEQESLSLTVRIAKLHKSV